MKKLLIIFLIFVLVAIIVGVILSILAARKGGEPVSVRNTFPISLLYPQASSGPEPSQSVEPGTNEFEENEPQALRPVPLSNEEAYGYWVQQESAGQESGTSTSMDVVFFFTKDGQLKKNDGTGEQQVGDVSYGVPISIKQNRAGTLAAVRFDSGSAYVYSTDRRAWKPVGDGVVDFAFSPDGTKLLALEERGAETALMQYEPFSAVERNTALLRLKAVNLRVQWQSASRVILTSVPSYFAEGSVWAVDLQRGTLTRIFSGSGTDALASQLDSRLLMFRPESKSKTTAGLYSANGVLQNGYSRMLLAAKCGASLTSPAFFCGAPQLLPSGSFIFPDDYLKHKVFTQDDLVSVQASGGMLTIPYSSHAYVDMSSVAHANGTVYFINRLDGKVYKLEIGM